jgi:glutamyl-tRNA reductase
VRTIAEEEFERHMSRLEEMDPDCRQAVSLMVRRIVNKMLHEPTVRLKASAAEGDGFFYAQTVRELFDLDLKPLSKVPPGNGQSFSGTAAAREEQRLN